VLERVAVVAVLAGCGDNLRDPFVELIRVSGDSPFDAACTTGQRGANGRGHEVEPWLAIDPNDPLHLIGVWQQDRWSSGGAAGLVTGTSFDGGATWTHSLPHFSRCAGGNFQRATDPWVSFGPDGTAHQIALAFDNTTPRHAILASRSTDGGLSWTEPATLRFDDDPDVFNDKESITADPTDPRYVYAVWDRITGQLHPDQPIGTGPAWFARSVDGAWEPALPIYDPGLDAQTIGNAIAVLPDGTLVDSFLLITGMSSPAFAAAIAVIRSTDRGLTWSEPIEIAKTSGAELVDPARDLEARTGEGLPAIAVDRSGALSVVWADARFGGGVDGIAYTRSVDGGLTWSPPVQVNQAPGFAAFTPAVAVTDDGAIGVTFYDRRDAATDASEFRVTPWLATSYDAGATWTEEPLSEPFDLRRAAIGDVYFLGDYQALAASGTELVPLFVGGTSPTDVFVRPVR
jgi:hypothetical protein